MNKNIAQQTFAIWLIQMVNVLLPMIDTYFLSGVSAKNVAAYALASSFYVMWVLACKGVLQGITFATAAKLDNPPTTTKLLVHTFWLLLVLTLVAWISLFISGLGIGALPINEPLKDLARQYLEVVAFGLPAILAARILVSWLESIGKSMVAVRWLWIGILLKGFLTYLFLGGYVGERWQNTTGAALSTNIFYWFVCMGMAVSVFRQIKTNLGHQDFGRYFPDMTAIKQVLRYGLPIAAAYLLEFSLFPMITSILAMTGEAHLAVYEILTVMYDFAMSVPIAFILACAIYTGQYYQKQPEMVLMYYKRAEIGLFVFVLVVTAVLWLSLPLWVKHYTTEQAMISLVAMAMPAFMWRSVIDAIQTLTAFNLRAVDKGWAAVLTTIVCLWGVAFLGIRLSYDKGVLDVARVWWWLGAGYLSSWILLKWWFLRALRRTINNA